MNGYVLTCTTAPVDGVCPAGSQQWVASTEANPFAMPAAAELSDAFDAAIAAFFWPTMFVLGVTLGARWILERIS